MRTLSVVTGLAGLLVLTSCATAPAPRSIENSFEYSDTYDSVWSAIIETMAEMNLPISAMEKDSGLIATDWLNFMGTSNNDYCDCGGLGINTERAREGKFNVFVRRDDPKLVVRVNCTFRQTIAYGNSHSTRDCVSTGAIERQIDEKIRDNLMR